MFALVTPGALKSLLQVATGVGSQWQHPLPPAKGQLLWEKGDAKLARFRSASSGFKASAGVWQRGEPECYGKPPTAPIEWRADGRTNSTAIPVSHSLVPYSLPHLTFSSHEVGFLLEKRTRNTGRVSEGQVMFCSEQHQGQYTKDL